MTFQMIEGQVDEEKVLAVIEPGGHLQLIVLDKSGWFSTISVNEEYGFLSIWHGEYDPDPTSVVAWAILR